MGARAIAQHEAPPTTQRAEEELEEVIRAFITEGLYNEALGLMMTTYGERIARFLMRRLGGQVALVEDLTQETFVRAMRGLPGFRGDARIFTWLTRIAHNVLYTAVYRHQRGQQGQQALCEQVGDPQEAEELEVAPVVGSASPRPDGGLWRRQVAEAIDACFERMNDVVRELAWLVWVEGHSFVEAAEITGMREDAVRKRLVRARPILQRCLELRGILEEEAP